MSTPPASTPSLEQAAETEIPLPIQHLFQTDPLNLSSEDATLLVQYYRMTRLRFSQAEATRPTTVRKNRGPSLAGDQASDALDDILKRMISSGDKP